MDYQRPTRLRRNTLIRNMVRENHITMDAIIYPLFVVEGNNIKEDIASMKNQYHLSVDCLIEEIKILKTKGIRNFLLFGTPNKKDAKASPAFDSEGIVQKAVKALNNTFDDIYIITDVCLCQYKSDGHCCIYDEEGEINRKATLEILGSIALSHVKAGTHMIAPSDMMDGRVGYIRKLLDREGFEHIPIMAYSAKYASSFYGPFRDAAHSAPAFGDRKTYQMDPANAIEAIKEMELDLKEGADILMVKPGMPYLDIIRKAKDIFHVPIAAYQVSGEYAMIKNAVDQGVLSKRAVYESLIAIKRSGADMIITYFAKELESILEEAARS